jgi:hypothetical protein
MRIIYRGRFLQRRSLHDCSLGRAIARAAAIFRPPRHQHPVLCWVIFANQMLWPITARIATTGSPVGRSLRKEAEAFRGVSDCPLWCDNSLPQLVGIVVSHSLGSPRLRRSTAPGWSFASTRVKGRKVRYVML